MTHVLDIQYEEGIKEGISKGKDEGIELSAKIVNLYDKGYTNDKIVKVCNRTIYDVEMI